MNDIIMNNPFPDIYLKYDSANITLTSPNSLVDISFKQTRETIGMDAELYKSFLSNAISRFRHSKTYKAYKYHLYDIGMDRCQVLGNITKDMADLEMHHNFINIHDIAFMICEHTLNTTGYITTYDLVQKLKDEHKENNVPLVMLSKTPHQLYHANEEFVLPANMCFGKWWVLLDRYKYGISLSIAYKIIYFLEKSIELEENKEMFPDMDLLDLRQDILDWSGYTEQLSNGIKYENIIQQ